jgi:hypothetical protein
MNTNPNEQPMPTPPPDPSEMHLPVPPAALVEAADYLLALRGQPSAATLHLFSAPTLEIRITLDEAHEVKCEARWGMTDVINLAAMLGAGMRAANSAFASVCDKAIENHPKADHEKILECLRGAFLGGLRPEGGPPPSRSQIKVISPGDN